ncbi:MAG: hypothetical protein KUG74_09705 [Rhodobacteraceae bacterium]|nr:hypothetical protein [Paracoccaceae bacterium]
MKITIEIDCTPAETREMLGLPNVQKIQENFMDQVEKKMVEEIENLSPESIMKSWISGASANMDWLPNLFSASATSGKSKS